MTCIVGLIDQQNKRVIIGGDSAESSGSSITIRKDPKVFRNGPFVFGCTSSFRMIQLLMHRLKFPLLPDQAQYSLDRYMTVVFVDAIRECFKEGGFLETNPGGAEFGGSFLVAYKDRLFKIQPDFQVSETIIGYDAVGSGADVAIGALHALSTIDLPAAEKIQKSLQAAKCHSLGVAPPFIIETTQ